MLKPGGQLFFNSFQKLITDEVYEKLDQGKWSKYNNRERISPFSKSENPLKEYENVIESVGFVDCHIFPGSFTRRISEQYFDGI